MNRTLELLVLAKDQTSATLGNIGGAVSGLGSIAAGVATGGLALAGAAIVAVGTAAVGAGLLIFNFSQDTNKAMKKFGAQVGLAGDELDEFKDVAKDVYAAGLGETIEEVVEQMSLVTLGLGETGEALENSTRRAMTLADVFGIDVAESINWVSSMTKSWKINSSEAFDVITRGMQMGLDVAGDFGDTLHEYSGDFDRLGLSADQMLSMLNAGLEAGAYNTDVVADGFREMGIRLMEGGEDVTAAFDQMGLDFEGMQASVAAGDETWGDYTASIIEGLLSIEDEIERNAAGVEIFGTKWEDVGGEVFIAAGQATKGIEGIGGATDAAAEQMSTGLGPALEGLKRTFLTEFEPLGDLAGEVINKMIPYLELAAQWLSEKVPEALEWLEEKWEEYWPIARDTLIGFWKAIRPKLNQLKELLGIFTDTVLPSLEEAWDDLKQGWEDITALSKDELVPALEDLWASVGLGGVEASGTAEAFGLFFGILSRIWTSQILQGIKSEMDGIAWFISLATNYVNCFKGGLDRLDGALRSVSDMLVWMKDRIWGAINAFNNLHLPSWLIPGSPTPLERGLLGIGDAFQKLDKMPQVNWGMASTGGGGGAVSAPGAASNVVINFGRDSVRSDEDLRYIIEGIQSSMELQGLRGRIA